MPELSSCDARSGLASSLWVTLLEKRCLEFLSMAFCCLQSNIQALWEACAASCLWSSNSGCLGRSQASRLCSCSPGLPVQPASWLPSPCTSSLLLQPQACEQPDLSLVSLGPCHLICSLDNTELHGSLFIALVLVAYAACSVTRHRSQCCTDESQGGRLKESLSSQLEHTRLWQVLQEADVALRMSGQLCGRLPFPETEGGAMVWMGAGAQQAGCS